MKDSIHKSRSFYSDYFTEEDERSYNNRQRYNIIYSLIEQVPLDPMPDVLDVGAGSGRITSFLDQMFDNVYSIDIIESPLLVEKIQDSKVEFVEGALPFLPFQSKSFDLVVCSEVIEHIPGRSEQVAAIEDLARVLSHEGWLVLSTPNPRSPHYRLKEAILRTAKSISTYERDCGQIVENWIPPEMLAESISTYLCLKRRRGSYYNLPGFGTGIERLFRPLSDELTSRNLFPRHGLYQYYVAQK
jgi:2-polyprenyl-3-methyl-5-hydroxy-6-metoxy-1,4-benzoquinol methylase